MRESEREEEWSHQNLRGGKKWLGEGKYLATWRSCDSSTARLRPPALRLGNFCSPFLYKISIFRLFFLLALVSNSIFAGNLFTGTTRIWRLSTQNFPYWSASAAESSLSCGRDTVKSKRLFFPYDLNCEIWAFYWILHPHQESDLGPNSEWKWQQTAFCD